MNDLRGFTPTPRKCEECGSREWPDILGTTNKEKNVMEFINSLTEEDCKTLMSKDYDGETTRLYLKELRKKNFDE